MLLLILLLQISSPVEPSIEIELLDPLKEYQESLIIAGDVQVVDGSEVVALRGAKDERILGVPRLVESTKGTLLTLRLIQTYLPGARLEFTVLDFNRLAFHLGFTYVLWESTCDAATNGTHTCRVSYLVRNFLREFGELPEAWPTDDEWAVVR